jgi:hypothetical protein
VRVEDVPPTQHHNAHKNNNTNTGETGTTRPKHNRTYDCYKGVVSGEKEKSSKTRPKLQNKFQTQGKLLSLHAGPVAQKIIEKEKQPD